MQNRNFLSFKHFFTIEIITPFEIWATSVSMHFSSHLSFLCSLFISVLPITLKRFSYYSKLNGEITDSNSRPRFHLSRSMFCMLAKWEVEPGVWRMQIQTMM